MHLNENLQQFDMKKRFAFILRTIHTFDLTVDIWLYGVGETLIVRCSEPLADYLPFEGLLALSIRLTKWVGKSEFHFWMNAITIFSNCPISESNIALKLLLLDEHNRVQEFRFVPIDCTIRWPDPSRSQLLFRSIGSRARIRFNSNICLTPLCLFLVCHSNHVCIYS